MQCKLAPVPKPESDHPPPAVALVKLEPDGASDASASEFQEPSALALYQEAVDSTISTFDDWLVLPHLALAEFLQLRGDYKAALDRWAHASNVLAKYDEYLQNFS